MRILILTAATGKGHLTAARALADAFIAARIDAVVKVFDVGIHPIIRGAVALYNFFLRRSPRWVSVYFAVIHTCRLSRLITAILRYWSEKIYRSEKPDFVVSVHPMLNARIAGTLSRTGGVTPFAIVLTDPFPPFFKEWAEPRASIIVVATHEAKDKLIAQGVPYERIEVIGIPLAWTLGNRMSREERDILLRNYGLTADRFTLLINAGSAGWSTTEAVFRILADSPELSARIQVIFVAGLNSVLAERVRKITVFFPVKILEWSEKMEELLDLADAIFTKPGGLSVFESLAKECPILVDSCHGIMPQERGIAEWLVKTRLGWKIHRPRDIVTILRDTPTSEWITRQRRCGQAVSANAATIARRLLAFADQCSSSRHTSCLLDGILRRQRDNLAQR